MLFTKNESEEKELWIVSLDFGNGWESEEFVETSEENALEKIKDLIKEKQPISDERDGAEVMNYITVAKVKVVEIKYPITTTTVQLA